MKSASPLVCQLYQNHVLSVPTSRFTSLPTMSSNLTAEAPTNLEIGLLIIGKWSSFNILKMGCVA